jgi:hypothetical protein
VASADPSSKRLYRHSSGAVFFDFNNDGLLDLFLTNVGIYTTNEKGRGVFIGDATTPSRVGVCGRAVSKAFYIKIGAAENSGRFKDMGLAHRGWSGMPRSAI